MNIILLSLAKVCDELYKLFCPLRKEEDNATASATDGNENKSDSQNNLKFNGKDINSASSLEGMKARSRGAGSIIIIPSDVEEYYYDEKSDNAAFLFLSKIKSMYVEILEQASLVTGSSDNDNENNNNMSSSMMTSGELLPEIGDFGILTVPYVLGTNASISSHSSSSNSNHLLRSNNNRQLSPRQQKLMIAHNMQMTKMTELHQRNTEMMKPSEKPITLSAQLIADAPSSSSVNPSSAIRYASKSSYHYDHMISGYWNVMFWANSQTINRQLFVDNMFIK
jgi:hypothetical protein